MKIAFSLPNKITIASFKSRWDLDDNAFNLFDPERDDFFCDKKDEFIDKPKINAMKSKKDFKIEKSAKNKIFSVQAVIDNFLCDCKDITDTKAVGIVAKAAYLFGMTLYPEETLQRNKKLKAYILKRLKERFPKPETEKISIQREKTHKVLILPTKGLRFEEREQNALRNLFSQYADKLTEIQRKTFANYLLDFSYINTSQRLQRKRVIVYSEIANTIIKLQQAEREQDSRKNIDEKILYFLRNDMDIKIDKKNEESTLKKFYEGYKALSVNEKRLIGYAYLCKEKRDLLFLAPKIGLNEDSHMVYHIRNNAFLKIRKTISGVSELPYDFILSALKKNKNFFTRHELSYARSKYVTAKRAKCSKEINGLQQVIKRETGPLETRIENKLFQLYMGINSENNFSIKKHKDERRKNELEVIKENFDKKGHIILNQKEQRVIEIMLDSNDNRTGPQIAEELRMGVRQYNNIKKNAVQKLLTVDLDTYIQKTKDLKYRLSMCMHIANLTENERNAVNSYMENELNNQDSMFLRTLLAAMKKMNITSDLF